MMMTKKTMLKHSLSRAALMASALVLAAVGGAQAQTTAAEQRLDELEARIARLEGLNQIERLQRTYGYFVDKRQWTQLAELFAENATLEIGGKGIFIGKHRVLEYMQVAFGEEELAETGMANHMQFQPVVNMAPDGQTAWMRSRAYVMGWGLPLYENEFIIEDGVWKISRLSGPFTMYSNWHQGWEHFGLENTWPAKFDPPPDLPPSTVYLTYPAYYIAPFHYPNPVTGKPFAIDPGVGAYHRPPGTQEQMEARQVGRLADGTQPLFLPPQE